jgi:hypothetical protein
MIRLTASLSPPKPTWEAADSRLRLAIDRRDEAKIELLQSAMRDWLHNNPPPTDSTVIDAHLEWRNGRLEQLQEAMVQSAEDTLLSRTKRASPGRYFFGPFPVPLQLLKIHMHALVKLQRLFRSKLSARHCANGEIRGRCLTRYFRCLDSWRTHGPALLLALEEADAPRNPLDLGTGHDPEWWARQRDPELICSALTLDLARLKRQGKRKFTIRYCEEMKAHSHRREENVRDRRLKAAFASLLGKHRSHYLYDMLQMEDGSINTDPVEIHRFFQRHYISVFEREQESWIQRLDLDQDNFASVDRWEEFLQDPETMTQTFLSHPQMPIPEHLIRAIANAFQPPAGAAEVELELEESFETPFTFEEFTRSIEHGCLRNRHNFS